MKIDFYIYNTHEIIVWENTIRSLLASGVSASYIMEAPEFNKALGTISDKSKNWLDDKESELQKLMTDDIFATSDILIKNLELPVLYESRHSADAVVTTQGIGWFDKYENLKFRTMYGVGATKNSYGHGVVNIGLDAIFVHGKFSQDEMSKIMGTHKIHIGGFPKWSKFFKNQIDKNEVKTKFGIHNNKPIITYIPTWAQNSSIDKYAEEILELSSQFNLLIKPHHNNYHFESERIQNLLNNPNIFVSDEINLMYYYTIADAIITDVRSGGFTEALLVDCPIIGLSPNENAEDDHLIKNIDNIAKIIRTTGSNFTEIIEKELERKKQNSLKNDLRNYFFENLNGNDDFVTANKMIEIIDSKKTFAVSAHVADIALPKISILIPTYNRREILELTLNSLEAQTINKSWYEVIVIDDGSTDDTIQFLENYKCEMNFRFITQENSGPATARNKGINLSKGKYVLFLNDDAVCEPHLLAVHLHFHKQFEKINVKSAVLGRFDYLNDDIDKLFMNLLHKSTLIFAYSEMQSNNLYPWNYFWTCNLSILRDAVIDAGMFDENFREPMMEDVELGLRLSLHGYNVFFTEQAITTHHHTITIDSFIRRQEMLGRNTVKLLNKHLLEHFGELQIFGIDKLNDEIINELKSKTENNYNYANELYDKIKIFENIRYSEHKFIKLNGEKRSFEEVQDIVYKLTNEINHFYYYKGIISAYNALEKNMETTTQKVEEKNIIFSVIVPTYNRSEILWKCLNSFCDQNFNFDSFEIIVVNDGSTDDTERIVKEFSAPFSLKYISQKNSGPATARNNAINVANGEFLLFINDDTIAHQNLLAEHYKIHSKSDEFPEANRNFAVLGTFDYVPEVKNKPFVNFLEKTAWIFAYPIMKSGHLYPYRFFWTCNISIKKSAVIEVGLFDRSFTEAMGEDTDLGYRLEKAGYMVYYHQNAISWHDHAMNVQNFTKRQQMSGRNMVKLFNKHQDLLPREQNLFGFNKLDENIINEFKDFVNKNQKDCERAISLIEEIDKINIFNPNFIPIQDNYIVNVNDIVKLIDKHIKIIHEYYFKLGIIEGYEQVSKVAEIKPIQAKNNSKLVDSVLKAYNSVAKNQPKSDDIPAKIAEKLSESVLSKFDKQIALKEEISEKVEIVEIIDNEFERIDDDDFDYLSILMDKPVDYSEFDENEENKIEEKVEELVEVAPEIIQEIKLPKRVLITMFGWNESGGGTMFPKQVAMKYADLGIETTVFFAGMSHPKTATPYYLEKQVEGNLTLYGLYNKTGHFLLGDHPEIEIADERVMHYFNQILDEVKPEIVHFHNFLGLSFKIAEEVHKRGIKSFFTPHNYHFIDPNLYMIKSNLKVWDNANFFEHSELLKSNPSKIKHYEHRVVAAKHTISDLIDYTLAISTREKEILVDFGANSEKIFVVHQAPLLSELEIKKNNFSNTKQPVKFGFIGSVIPHKGVHKLVIAAQILEKGSAEIHIYGLGNELYKKELMKIDTKGLCVWHGEYEYSELPQILDELDCVVVPSIWEEAAGLVVLEAIGYGVPVIGARIGGIPDFIIENVNGRTYPANSERNLAALLKELVDFPEILDKYKSNCKKAFKFSDYINHILNLYNKAIGNEIIDKSNAEFIYQIRV